MSDEWVVTMPKLGETVTEGTIGNWLKQVGDTVEFDDPLFEVSTDKVDSEIPSPYDGVIVEILVGAGETVPVGTPLVRIGARGSSGPRRGRTGCRRRRTAVAAAGGPALGDPASPADGRLRGHGRARTPASAVPAGVVHDITMPKLGETVTEGTIGSWLKQAGDTVEFDDPLFEVSTDKVDSEIPSPYDGVMLEILVAEGETVPVGTVLARIGEPGAAAAAGSRAPPRRRRRAPQPLPRRPPRRRRGAPAAADRNGRMLSPLVRRLVAEAGLDVAAITGSGAGGRIRREDVERAIAAGTGQAQAPAAAAAGPCRARGPGGARARCRPGRTRGPARRGRLGRLTTRATRSCTLSRMRLAVAGGHEGLADARGVACGPRWRSTSTTSSGCGRSSRTGSRPRPARRCPTCRSSRGPTVDALRAYPTVNSSIDVEAKTMTLHPYVNLGIAVDLDQQGLVVPVVRDADGLNIRGIAKKITEMAGAARGEEAGDGRHAGLHVHDHQPRPVRQLGLGADHQPAQHRHPLHRRREAPPGRGRRHDRHPPDRHHRARLRPPRVRRVHRVAVPPRHPRRAGAAGLGGRDRLRQRGRRGPSRSR